MDIRKTARLIKKIIKENFVLYLIGFMIIFGVKYFYSKAGCDELKWILAPTARWVEILSGIPFEYEQGAGYVNHSLRLLIASSCSGVQFMIITIATLIFSFTHKIGNGLKGDDDLKEDICLWEGNGLRGSNAYNRIGRGMCWIAASLLLSYLLTIFVNGLRIIVAIYLPLFLSGTKLYGGILTAERLHTLIGTVVYFIALLTIYQLTEYLFQKREKQSPRKTVVQMLHRCAPPAFWYFAIVLGVPFLNRAYQKNNGQFTEFTILITVCCTAILLLYCLAFLLRKFLRHKFQRS